MFKAIILFIKTHIVVSTITATVIVSTVVAAPIMIENYKLDKDVKENLNMLVSSNFQTNVNNSTENTQVRNEDNTAINTNELLTFRIEKVYSKKGGGNIVKDMQGNDAYEMSSEGVEYKIVPSYDKEYSKWTKEEKEAYQKAYEEVGKMAEEQYKKDVESEKQNMLDATQEIEKVTSKIESSYSKEYFLGWFPSPNGWNTAETWKYNYYTKLYSGGSQENYEVVTKEFGNLEILDQGVPFTGITIETFKSKVYPALMQKINQGLSKEEKQQALDKLDELYHLAN